MDSTTAQSIRKLAWAGAAGLALSYAGYLALMLRSHTWFVDAHGRPTITDFLVFQVSGSMALHGRAVSAYDPYLEHLAQVTASGQSFVRYLPWHYPPTFFFVTAALALLPYAAAFLIWVTATLAAYGTAIATAARTKSAFIVACAAPAVFINVIAGQNACLMAALMTAVLLTLEERPIVSGTLLGLMAFKPQFAVLFPIALAAGGYWRALTAALVTGAASVVASAIVFGDQTIPAFLHDLRNTSNDVLVHGAMGWNNLQSFYGLVRWLGMDNGAASAAHIAIVLSAALTLVWIWRQPLPTSIKAAVLALCALLASPHSYMYDFVILSVPLAFLYRERAFDPVEVCCVVLANIFVGGFFFYQAPIGLAGSAIVAALIARRTAQAYSSGKAITLRGPGALMGEGQRL